MQIGGKKNKKAKSTTPPHQAAPAGGAWGGDCAAPKVAFAPSTETGVDDRDSSSRAPRARPANDHATVTDAHIQMLEPEASAASSIRFGDLAADDGQKLKEILDTFGFAVVTDVLTDQEVQTYEGLFSADLAGIVETKLHPHSKQLSFLKDPVRQWPTKSNDFSLGTKFATMYGLPQGQCAWGVRAHPNVRAVYESIYHTDKLCCGMDNVFYNPNASAEHDDSKRENNLWPHADQNGHLRPEGKFEVYQSVVYLWPADIDTSATVVLPGSNGKAYDSLMTYTNAKSHFCMWPKSDFGRIAQEFRRVPVPSGGMLLWSSKTTHQGWSHGKRLAIPVCYEPVSRRSEEALKRKIDCVRYGQPTTHWASLGKPHSMSRMCTGADGGTTEVVLKHRAHTHCLDAAGQVVASIQQWL